MNKPEKVESGNTREVLLHSFHLRHLRIISLARIISLTLIIFCRLIILQGVPASNDGALERSIEQAFQKSMGQLGKLGVQKLNTSWVDSERLTRKMRSSAVS